MPVGNGTQTSGTPTARIGVDLRQLQQAPAAARTAAQATSKEIEKAFRESQRAQATAEKQRTAELQAALTQRRVAVRVAVREETEMRRAALREQAAAEKQRTAEMKAALTQRRIAVRAAAREEAAAASLGRGLSTVAGAFGVTLGVAGAVQLGREVVAATQAATAYDRQNIAALRLAGSQTKLNELLRAYDAATGGAVDQAQALADVTRLQAIGFAKSAPELERFVRAARGAALAMGKPQEDIIQEVQLAISNQSIRRLDQIGLGVAEVNARIAELRENNRGMTREAAFQEAILSKLTEKYGGLTQAAEAQATGIEKLTRAQSDLRLELGQFFEEGTSKSAGFWAKMTEGLTNYMRALQQWGQPTLTIQQQRFVGAMAPIDIGRHPRAGGGADRFTADQSSLITDRFESLNRIEADAAKARVDATRQHEEQRTNIIRDYGKSTAREAEDFARSRLNQERKLNLAILDVAADSARQRTKWEEDLARAQAERLADSNERIAEARADSNKRLSELEEDYQRDREKAAGDHREKLLDAAARLDAAAVVAEQRRFARESKDAEEAHNEQRSDINEQLQERIADEQKTLEKANRQAEEAHRRQLEEQAENDRLRIQEMKDNFEEQKAQEDEERAIRLGRQAQDHQDQLDELDRQFGLRLQQINTQAGEERAAFETEFEKALAEQGIKTDRWIAANEKLTDAAIKDFDRWFKHVNTAFGGTGASDTGIPGVPRLSRADGGPIHRTGTVLAHAGEFMLSPHTTRALQGVMGGFDQASLLAAVRGGGARSITVAPGAVVIHAAPGQSIEALGQIVRAELLAALQAAA